MLNLSEATVRDPAMTAAERERYTGSYDIGGAQIHVLENGEQHHPFHRHGVSLNVRDETKRERR